MPVKATYAGYVRGGAIHLVSKSPGSVVTILTNLEPARPGDGPGWTVSLTIGTGAAARAVDIALAPLVSKQDYEASAHDPVFVTADRDDGAGGQRPVEVFILFRDRLFLVDRGRGSGCSEPLTAGEVEELKLRAKRVVYGEEEELISIRSYVANVEAAREYQKSGPKRDPIPADVQLLVWSRDGGACVRCGSKEKLHFDHIIPVAKGGASTAENIQILCEPCNLKKSDKIGF